MSKADYLAQVKEGGLYELPCNCHPETCSCGEYKLVRKPKYKKKSK